MSLQDDIHAVLDKLSNNEGDQLGIDEAWIKSAGEKVGQVVEAALTRQFTRRDEDFRLRMSNIDKPLCQLQMAKSGAVPERKDYNFVMRMLHGDIIESIMDLILEIAQANITGGKTKVKLELDGTTIKGENDIEIDNKVYDIKSSAPFSFDRKWKKGIDGLKSEDPFGYIGQLVGYSEAQGMDTGGWIVVCKSTGQVVVVEADFSDEEKATVLARLQKNATAIKDDWQFSRCFEPVDDFFNRKYTNSKKLPMSCGFCDFKQTCWPNAKLLPSPKSKAKEPPKAWYTRYDGVDL